MTFRVCAPVIEPSGCSVALPKSVCEKSPAALELGRQVRPRDGRRPDVFGELLRREEVELLLARAAVHHLRDDDRPADAVAADVHFEERLRIARLLAEEVVLVPLVAAEVRPAGPAELVGARLGGDLHEARRLPAVLGVVAARDHVHFTNRVDVRGHVRRARAAFFADRHAVNRGVLVERVAPVDAQVAARVPLRVVAAGVRVHDARQDLHHAEHVAALHLHHDQRVPRDVAGQRAVGGLHGRDFRGDRDRFGHAAGRHRDSAERPDFAAEQRELRDGHRTEAVHFDLDRVATGDERHDAEIALFVRRARAVGVRRHVRGGNGRSRDDADVVDDRADERAIALSALRKRGNRACQKDQKGYSEYPQTPHPFHLHSFRSGWT